MLEENFWNKNLSDHLINTICPPSCDIGKCCSFKLEDIVNAVYYTNVSCKLLCEKTAQCKKYEHKKIVKDLLF